MDMETVWLQVPRKSAIVLDRINHVFDANADNGVTGVTALIHKGRIILISDTLVQEWPNEKDLADIAENAAVVARQLGLEPRVAFVSFSTFGHPVSERAEKMYLAPAELDSRSVNFEYEGEMTADVALNMKAMEAYPLSLNRLRIYWSCRHDIQLVFPLN